MSKENATPTPQVKVTQYGGEFRVDIKWLSKPSAFIITFAIMWNGIISVAITLLFLTQSGRQQSQNTGYLMVGLFGVIGLCLLYFAVCEIFNTTTIIIKANKMSFWTRPISLYSTKTIDVLDISNLTLSRVKNGQQNNRRVFKHFINILLKNKKTIRLCKVQDLNEGMYVEKLLEDRLNLKDDPNLDKIDV